MSTDQRLIRQQDPRTQSANIERLATLHRLINVPDQSTLADLYDLPAAPTTNELARFVSTLVRTLTGKRN